MVAPIYDIRTARNAIENIERKLDNTNIDVSDNSSSLTAGLSDLTQAVANQRVRLGVVTVEVSAYVAGVMGQGEVQLYSPNTMVLSSETVVAFSTYGSAIVVGQFVYVVQTSGSYLIIADAGAS